MKKILFTAIAVIAMTIVPATSMAAPVKFGSKLNPTVQPSNSLPGLDATEHALEMAPLVAFRQPVPRSARGNVAVQNLVIKGTLPPRVRRIFGIPWSAAHEAAFRSVAAAHRRARPAFPRGMRRGRNDVFFDLVTQTEKRRGGTAMPRVGDAA